MEIRNVELVRADPRTISEYDLFRLPKPLTFHRQIRSALAKPDAVAVTSTAGLLFEKLLRDWLSTQFTLSPNRGLAFERFDGVSVRKDPNNNGYSSECHEIDAVIGEDEPQVFVEIRASCTRYSQSSVRYQLKQRLDIARKRWPNVAGATIVVRTGPWRYKRHPKKLVQDMQIDLEAFWQCIADDEEPQLVFDLPELEEYARTHEIEFGTEFLYVLNDFAVRNFERRTGNPPRGSSLYERRLFAEELAS